MPNGATIRSNPFAVQTPEDVPAADVVSVFVNVFTDFYHIPKEGHTFIHGPRGSGKSMMFRYLEPDCQTLARGCSLEQLPFLGVYAPIKNTDLKLTELGRLEHRHADAVLNEHFLTLYAAIKIFASLGKVAALATSIRPPELETFYTKVFAPLIRRAGWRTECPPLGANVSATRLVEIATSVFDDMYTDVLRYLKRLSFIEGDLLPYSGPLCGYLDFLEPLVEGLRLLSFMPNGPVFLLIDDADNLNVTQTKVLNSWVSSRTSRVISLKISTQLGYKTYRTVTGQRIDAPHDFSEVNISSIYTTSRARYRERIHEIVLKRLKRADIDTTPEAFFPEDVEQEMRIKEIGDELLTTWDDKGRGSRPRDDVARYARPLFIRGLKGSSKSGSSYSYAGFRQLVHISSGIVRYFLEAASQMYGEEQALNPDEAVLFIRPHLQNSVVREQADSFLFSEFDKILTDETLDRPALDRAAKLRNLIVALGGYFHQLLVSDAAERRVFSIAFSDSPDADLEAVLKMGIQYGYFHESAIGNKDGTGRTRLYVLTRRLAPYFTLDPSSFAGYKFVASDFLREAMLRPNAFLRRIKAQLLSDDDGPEQAALFEGAE